jgi:hypothetical protein
VTAHLRRARRDPSKKDDFKIYWVFDAQTHAHLEGFCTQQLRAAWEKNPGAPIQAYEFGQT